jgi:hypothetical protein
MLSTCYFQHYHVQHSPTGSSLHPASIAPRSQETTCAMCLVVLLSFLVPEGIVWDCA